MYCNKTKDRKYIDRPKKDEKECKKKKKRKQIKKYYWLIYQILHLHD